MEPFSERKFSHKELHELEAVTPIIGIPDEAAVRGLYRSTYLRRDENGNIFSKEGQRVQEMMLENEQRVLAQKTQAAA